MEDAAPAHFAGNHAISMGLRDQLPGWPAKVFTGLVRYLINGIDTTERYGLALRVQGANRDARKRDTDTKG
jgi:hypothetical protein